MDSEENKQFEQLVMNKVETIPLFMITQHRRMYCKRCKQITLHAASGWGSKRIYKCPCGQIAGS